jgi:hypothetical protein
VVIRAARKSRKFNASTAATDAALFDRLVRTRGWSVQRFGEWLGVTLSTQLLGIVPRTAAS